MMNVIIIGAQASGKMTIGQELEKVSDLKLFHNHDSIDFVTRFLPMSPEARELIDTIRFDFFEAFVKADRGLIFTVVIDFNDENDLDFLRRIQEIFHSFEREVLFVELETDLQERLRSNTTENRLQHKPWKRNVEWSESDILSTMEYACFNPKKKPKDLVHYVKINNTDLSAKATAELIRDKMEQIEGGADENP